MRAGAGLALEVKYEYAEKTGEFYQALMGFASNLHKRHKMHGTVYPKSKRKGRDDMRSRHIQGQRDRC